jgi:hypothetical protein
MLKNILIVLLLTGFVYADDVDNGVKAAGKNDYKTAVKLFSKACDMGSAVGCNNLGVMYYEGQGVRQDSFKAVELFTKACDMKSGLGCDILGSMYYHGEGFNKTTLKL